jgi:hypothetical protein
MLIQITLYYEGFSHDILYYPVGAATAFVGGLIFLLMHWILPEFVFSVIWISGEIRGFIVNKRLKAV